MAWRAAPGIARASRDDAQDPWRKSPAAPRVGGAVLQDPALDGDVARRTLCRDGRTGVARRGPSRLLPSSAHAGPCQVLTLRLGRWYPPQHAGARTVQPPRRAFRERLCRAWRLGASTTTAWQLARLQVPLGLRGE